MSYVEKPHDPDIPYEPHVGTSRQYWRDIILGVNDGLVSTILLVAVIAYEVVNRIRQRDEVKRAAQIVEVAS